MISRMIIINRQDSGLGNPSKKIHLKMLFLEYSKHVIIQSSISFLFQTFDGCVLSAVYDASSIVHHVDNRSLSEIIRRISEIIFIPIRSDSIRNYPIRTATLEFTQNRVNTLKRMVN